MLLESCLGLSEASLRLCEQFSKQRAVLGKKAVYAKSTILRTDYMITMNTALSRYTEMT